MPRAYKAKTLKQWHKLWAEQPPAIAEGGVLHLQALAAHLRLPAERGYYQFSMDVWFMGWDCAPEGLDIPEGRAEHCIGYKAGPLGECTELWPEIWIRRKQQPVLDLPSYKDADPWKSAAYWFGISIRDALSMLEGSGDVGMSDEMIPPTTARKWLELPDYPKRNVTPEAVADNIERFIEICQPSESSPGCSVTRMTRPWPTAGQ